MKRNERSPNTRDSSGWLSRRAVILGTLGASAIGAAAVVAPRLERIANLLGVASEAPLTTLPSIGFTTAQPGVPERVASFGPNGTHWPLGTPSIEGRVDHEILVDCTWTALASAVQKMARDVPDDQTVRILIKPGTLEGFGSGARSEAVLADVGSLSRSTRILLYPRDGYGSVRINDSWRWSGVHGVALAGIITAGSFLASGCNGSAFARMKVTGYNVQGNDNVEFTEDIELVEIVVPDMQKQEQDVASFRTPSSNVGGLRRVNRVACYTAPAYQPTGSDAHCDTLQMSGQGENYYGEFGSIDCADFASTNAALQIGSAYDLRFEHCLILGGEVGRERYPLDDESDSGGSHHAFNGAGQLMGCAAKDSIFVGSMGKATWSSVRGTSINYRSSGAPPEEGGFDVDESLLEWKEPQIAAVCPYPTDDYLTEIWS